LIDLTNRSACAFVEWKNNRLGVVVKVSKSASPSQHPSDEGRRDSEPNNVDRGSDSMSLFQAKAILAVLSSSMSSPTLGTIGSHRQLQTQ
jgi:hypothetical protein